MPNSQTFRIKPIKELIGTYLSSPELSKGIVIDPFVRDSVFKEKTTYTNDLNPDYEADYHEDALYFLNRWTTDQISVVLFDPPYSPRQITECYQSVGKKVTMTDTQASFWGNMKKAISRIVHKGGIVISCGWNSGGIGRSNGFELEEVLLVPHGGWHNDTIVTVDRKL